MNMKKYTVMVVMFAMASFQLLAYQNCSDVNFAASEQSASGAECELSYEDIKSPLKVLFMLDVSGSNTNTDPNKVWRHDVLSRFFDRYATKSNFTYNIGTFGNSKAISHVNINYNNRTENFSNDSNIIDSAVNNFNKISDYGNTPYKAAIDTMKSMISNDISIHGKTSIYSVIFISDGQPNPDYDKGADLNAAIEDVKSLTSLYPESIYFNTVYYYSSSKNSSAQEFLNQMAIAGKGKFLVANSQEAIDLDKITKVPVYNCN